MKHLFLTSLFLGFFSLLSAQNWAPFYPEDTCIYQNDNSEFYAHTVWIDSVFQSPEGITWSFNPSHHLCDTCDVNRYCGNKPLLVDQPFPFGAAMTAPDGQMVVFDQGEGGNIVLLGNASPGTSWVMDSSRMITAWVAKVYPDTIWGQVDSVKVIHLSTGDSILLSQAHGLISFPDSISRGNQLYLAGILNRELGEEVIDFWDIYDFQVGDVLFYEYGYSEVGVNWDVQSKVTILSNQRKGDTILVDVLMKARQESNGWGAGGNVYGYDSIRYTWKFIYDPDRIVNQLPEQIQFSENQGFYFFHPQRLWPDPQPDTNLITIVRISSSIKEAKNLYTNDSSYFYGCGLNSLPNLSFPLYGQTPHATWRISARYEKGLGQTLYELSGFEGGGRIYLVGHIRNGDTVGTVFTDEYLFVSNEDELPSGSVQIYPNPASESLTISLSEARFLPVEVLIRDLRGRTVLVSELTAPDSTLTLPGLPTGLYYLEVRSRTGRTVFREKVFVE